ncbi:nucleotidyl transferase AbiEii/AbiGii toxin family protein [Chroococcidiopsis sp. CCMEE 29]|uniref:nucleotidyl transferase AbiEii/AbiGii toxin family protein n=1 Tax=Chroococcidiopsis sp. CCMEE 29 TaxID=155894 RepID=UPI00201FCB69|nr:nucleotidyl transferase AbiEii/AbiGii toxin family protein [Chroococcidiopsis sp. CCMEE 29]
MNQQSQVAARVRQRLKNLATKLGEDFQSLLTRYALERLLYRLSQSQSRDTFILKGALLFSIWSLEPHRATRDIDLLGYGDNTLSHLEQVWRHICQIPVDSDGLEFKEDTWK